MNPDSLRALLIDHQLGELSPEASELLDAYLAREPEAEAEAAKMRATLGVAEKAVNEHPDMFRVEGTQAKDFSYSLFLGIFRAAAVAVVLLFAGIAGYFFGQKESPEPDRSSSLLASTEKAPWARYRLNEDSSIALISNSSNQGFTGKE